jgi:hypothetical protein
MWRAQSVLKKEKYNRERITNIPHRVSLVGREEMRGRRAKECRQNLCTKVALVDKDWEL